MTTFEIVEYNIATAHSEVVDSLPYTGPFSVEIARDKVHMYASQDTETDHTYYVRER